MVSVGTTTTSLGTSFSSTRSTTFDTDCRALHTTLNHLFLVGHTNAGATNADATNDATFRAMASATTNVMTLQPRIDAIAHFVRYHLERDLFRVTESMDPTTLPEWTASLERVREVQTTYARCVYPYNAGVRRFRSTTDTTDTMVHAWVHRLLHAHETELDSLVHHHFCGYLTAALAWTAAPVDSLVAHMETSRHLPFLSAWMFALEPYAKGLAVTKCPAFARVVPSVLPFAHESFTGFIGLSHNLDFLANWYTVERLHGSSFPGEVRTDASYAAHLIERFDVAGEWQRTVARLNSANPRVGAPSLFYDDELFTAFVEQDGVAVERFGVRLATSASLCFNARGCIQLMYMYARAATSAQPVCPRHFRRYWAFLGMFGKDGPGGCFAGTPYQELRRLLSRTISKEVVERLSVTASDNPLRRSTSYPPVLMTWMFEMMEPGGTMSWADDSKWWTSLVRATTDCERLLRRYVEQSFQPRVVLGDVDVEAEMELMVVFSDVLAGPSRALQWYRMLLPPWHIRPVLDGPASTRAYLVPEIAWSDVPANAPDTALHPAIAAPLVQAKESYERDYFPERRVAWSHWYSTASVTLTHPSGETRQLHAPLFAVHVVATLASFETGPKADVHSGHASSCNASPRVTITDIVDKTMVLTSPAHRSIARLHLAFWLQQLVVFRVVHAEYGRTGTPTHTPTSYTLCQWTGERHVPIPDVPAWWRVLKAGCKRGASADADAPTTTTDSPADETLLVAQEHLQAAAMRLLKHNDVPTDYAALLLRLCDVVSPYVVVTTTEAAQAVAKLVDRGDVARTGETVQMVRD